MSTELVKQEEKKISFVPLGEKQPVELTINMVRKFLCTSTRSGKLPSDADVVKFMMLCKARELNPWVGDAYLIGFDSSDGPTFNLITAAQALLKRAEMSHEFDGLTSGVIVAKGDNIDQREGKVVLPGEKLVGAWARCWRKNLAHAFFDSLQFSTFDTGRSRWKADPAGMIVKCAESAVLRKAFPTQLGGLYTDDEMAHIAENRKATRDERIATTSLESLKEQFIGDTSSDANGEANEPGETSESQVAATVTDILDTAREAMRRKRSDESLDLVFEGACVDLEQAVSGTELRAAIAALGDCRAECLEKIGKQKPGDLFENDETAQDAS